MREVHYFQKCLRKYWTSNTKIFVEVQYFGLGIFIEFPKILVEDYPLWCLPKENSKTYNVWVSNYILPFLVNAFQKRDHQNQNNHGHGMPYCNLEVMCGNRNCNFTLFVLKILKCPLAYTIAGFVLTKCCHLTEFF